jgi:protease II
VLEDTESPEFKEAVASEMELWDDAVRRVNTKKRAWLQQIRADVASALPHTPEYSHETIVWNGHVVKLQHTFGHRVNVWICSDGGRDSSKEIYSCMNVSAFGYDPESRYFFTIHDIGSGSETLELRVYVLGHKQPAWKISPVGPSAAFKADRIYFQTVENQLRYPAVVSLEKESGRHRRMHYNNRNKQEQVTLCAQANQPDLFVHTANALCQRLGRIAGASVQWMDAPSHSTLVPVNTDVFLSDKYLHVNSHKYRLPDGYGVDAMQTPNGEILVTTVKNGCMNIYTFVKNTFTALQLHTSPCEIVLRHASTVPTFELKEPHVSSRLFNYVGGACVQIAAFPTPLSLRVYKHGFARSNDGTRVPYTYVSATRTPKKLLVEGYGAYGISAHRSYPIRWLSWLARGYAIAVAMPRGGRENGDEWYDGGRTAARKHNTFDDTAAVIQAVQRRFDHLPRHTVFYGRSAGGWLAAVIAQQYTHLVGAVYAEVPYVDVLRTTTNPALPLTQLEYDEFGDPAHRREDYVAVQRISPVDTVPLAPPHAPLVVVRTGLYDAQVYPYEALKWAKKLRAHGWTVYAGIDGDGGHFAAEEDMCVQQAEDAALIDAYLGGDGERDVTRRASRRSRGVTRRRRTSS